MTDISKNNQNSKDSKDSQDNAKKGIILVSIDDINESADHSNIYSLYDLLEREFFPIINMRTACTTVAIPNVENMEMIKFLLIKASEIFDRTSAINNRKTNVLIFEYGNNAIKKDMIKCIELKSLVVELNVFLNIKNPLSWHIDELLLKNVDNKNKQSKIAFDDKTRLFLTYKQRDELELLRNVLGVKSKGLLGLVYVIYSLNAIFGKEKNYADKIDISNRNNLYIDLCHKFVKDDELIDNIKNDIKKYENELRDYLKKGIKGLKIKLKLFDLGDRSGDTDEKKRVYILEFIDRIENAIVYGNVI